MYKRDFPEHAAWPETLINGDHVLAFVAIQQTGSDDEPFFHRVYDRTYFARQCDALEAARDALGKLVRIDEHHRPVFSSAEC